MTTTLDTFTFEPEPSEIEVNRDSFIAENSKFNSMDDYYNLGASNKEVSISGTLIEQSGNTISSQKSDLLTILNNGNKVTFSSPTTSNIEVIMSDISLSEEVGNPYKVPYEITLMEV